MKQDVAAFAQTCLTCQQVKEEHERTKGELQPIQIPQWKWDDISIDFIMGLPWIVDNYDMIWVDVDKFTNYVHFLLNKITCTMEHLAELYISEVVKLHEVSKSIISANDSRFTSHF